MTQHEDAKLEWAGFRIPAEVAAGHFCIMGTVGSGTTLTLRSLMPSVLKQIDADSDRHAVILDKAQDMTDFLRRREVSCPIYTLNPFDPTGFGWDIASDWTEPSMARHYAELLIPDPDPTDEIKPYFCAVARSLLQPVLRVLMQRGPSWTLTDLVEITTDPDRLQQTLLSTPDSAAIASRHMGSPKTFENTFYTLAGAMQTLEGIAAATKALPPQRRMGISEWSKSKGSILLLETPNNFEHELRELYRLILDTTARHAVGGLESPSRWKNWFFLEDVDTFPSFAALPRLLTSGRAFGARVAFSCMDIESMRGRYGEKIGLELLSGCSNHSILRQISMDTADWAAQLASQQNTYECRSAQASQQLIEVDLNQGFRDPKLFRPRARCKPDDFYAFPLPTNGHVTGCHISQSLGAIVRETVYDISDGRPAAT